MPLTADHATAGVLDATLPDLGTGTAWDTIHRARPRAPLTCRGCGSGLHAKTSRNGLRFFAHDAKREDCPLHGETIEHRLLKAALAAAARDAGWHAQLEVAGTGTGTWRADVLASSPDGTRRVALEAQVSTITRDKIAERTANLATAGVDVCWITPRITDWVGTVPYLLVDADEHGVLQAPLGLWRYTESHCPDRHDCEWVPYSRRPRPVTCPGHPYWAQAPATLTDAIGWILTRRVVPHQLPRTHSATIAGKRVELHVDWTGPDTGHTAWTAPAYIAKEAPARAAAARERDRADAEALAQAEHRARAAELATRQQALVPRVIHDLIRAGERPRIVTRELTCSPQHAMGVPIVAAADRRQLLAVICPVASRIDPATSARLAGTTIVVATEAERARIAKRCHPDQRIDTVRVDHAAPAGT